MTSCSVCNQVRPQQDQGHTHHPRLYHVLPNLAVRDEPHVWQMVIDLLRSRGLSREEALTRIRFAYTGSLSGDLPPGVS